MSAGQPAQGIFFILLGKVAVIQRDGMGNTAPIVELGPGDFVAELGTMSGKPSLVDAVAMSPSEALVLEPKQLRALIIAEADLGERLVRALILRRVSLIERGATGPVLIGRPGSIHLLRLQSFLRRTCRSSLGTSRKIGCGVADPRRGAVDGLCAQRRAANCKFASRTDAGCAPARSSLRAVPDIVDRLYRACRSSKGAASGTGLRQLRPGYARSPRWPWSVEETLPVRPQCFWRGTPPRSTCWCADRALLRACPVT